jgi:bestrophin-3
MRRTVMRYVNLAAVHSMTMFSSRVRKRFPDLDHFVTAGLMNENERDILADMSTRIKKLYFVPLIWAVTIITRARNEGRIKTDILMKTCLDHITIFRQRCGRSLQIDTINVPLVYSQVSVENQIWFSGLGLVWCNRSDTC